MMDYAAAKKHIEKTLHFDNVIVAPQNLNKYSRPAYLLNSKGLPSTALIWVWNYRTDGSTRWIGAFIENVCLKWGALLPSEVFRSPYKWRVEGKEYTFFRL